jgi:hypothetical protein
VKDETPKGKLFSELYCDRGKPVEDSEQFRRRIGVFCSLQYREYETELGDWLRRETGLIVPWGVVVYDLERFFVNADLVRMLNSITHVFRCLFIVEKKLRNERGYTKPLAALWMEFVNRALREEHMGYKLDAAGGVHYSVDEEYEHNLVSVLRCLESTKYAGVRAAFEDAHRYLDSVPRDTKAAVRSAFESLEILAKLIVPRTKNLNKWFVENELKPIALEVHKEDEVAVKAISGVFDGFAQWVDGLHNYRHGQGLPEPVAPPIELAIYVVSTTAAHLRWLVEIDTKRGKKG